MRGTGGAPRAQGREQAGVQATAGAFPNAAAPAEPATAESQPAEDTAGRSERRDRQRHERAGDNDGERGRGRPRGERRERRAGDDGDDRQRGRDHRPRRQDDRRPQRENRGEPLRFSTEPPKGDKRGGIDPNSPFAALAALKARLEGGERDS
jgi:ATP-dependent RNA helicase SUPV3L1/SUV3